MLVIDHSVAKEILTGGPDSTPLAFRIDKVQERKPGIILPKIAEFELKRELAEANTFSSMSVITENMSPQVEMLSTPGLSEYETNSLWSEATDIMQEVKSEQNIELSFIYAYLVAYTILTGSTFITNNDKIKLYQTEEARVKKISDNFFSITWKKNFTK